MARSPHIHTYDMSHPFLLSYTTALLHYNAVFCCQRKKIFMPSWTQHDGPYLGCVRNNIFLGEKKIYRICFDFFFEIQNRNQLGCKKGMINIFRYLGELCLNRKVANSVKYILMSKIVCTFLRLLT